MGGGFHILDGQDTEGLTAYMDSGKCTAVVLGNDSFTELLSGKKDEKLLLAFPSSGKHTEENRRFLAYMKNQLEKADKGEGN